MQLYHTWFTVGVFVLTLGGSSAAASPSADCTERASAQSVADPNKIALIIAIGDYDPTTGWNNLGSKYDVPLVMATLAAQGFDTVNNVAVLRDEQATRAGIAQAIRQHLVDKAQSGSIALLHYSGHGQQVFDDNSDELDGFDEALVPYDAPQKAEGQFANYKGEKHVRDDELGALLKEVRQKVGPSGDLLVVLDACHSGTATRGELTHARGTKVKIAPEGYQPTQSRGDSEDWNEAGEGAQLSPMVVISGASADQLNYEAKDGNGHLVGSLSLAMSRTLSNAEATTSYRGLFDKVIVEMSSLAPRQTPQIEGDLNRQILGGQAVPRLSYFGVKDRFDKKNIIINGGQLYGIFEGTEVALYDIDTQDTAGVSPKAIGQVTYAYMQESDVMLDRELSKKEVENSWVFLKSRNFGSMQVNVKLDIQSNESFAEALRNEFAKAPLIRITPDSPDLLVEMNNEYTKSRGGNALQIITANDYVYYDVQVPASQIPALAEKVTEQIISYAQASFLRNLELENRDMRVSLEAIPIEVKQQGRRVVKTGRIPIEEKMDNDGILVFNEGDHFKLRVINHGKKKVYFTILDIQPDNVINAMIPNNGRPASEYSVKAGDTLELGDIFKINPPYGTDLFKLIATKDPIDIHLIVANRGSSTTRGQIKASRGVRKLNPLEELLLDSYKSKDSATRGSETQSVPPSSGNIETLVYRIQKEP